MRSSVLAVSLAVSTLFVARGATASVPSTKVDLGGGVTLDLVLVPAGTFEQGSSAGEPGHAEDETRRTVTISKPYYLGVTPVTVGQFERFVADSGYRTEAERGTSGGFGFNGSDLVQDKKYDWRHPGFSITPDDPVTIVTFADAKAFSDWLARRANLLVRLPTEAEMERAAHGTNASRFVWGDDPALAEKNAWFAKNAGKGTHPVAKLPANSLGLFDMTGNVWQWCVDYYDPISGDAVTNPVATIPMTWKLADKPRRVLKGGSWHTDDRMKLRIAARYRATDGSRNADFGFRVAADVGAPPPPVPAPAPGPAAPAETPSTPPPAPSEGGGVPWGWLGLILGGGGVAAYFATRKSQGRASARPAARLAPGSPYRARLGVDGFWIDAPPSAAEGDEVAYDAWVDGRSVTGRARLTRSPKGTFVYTGQAPTTVSVTDLFVAAPVATSPSRWTDDSPSQLSSGSGGWPSAY